MWPGRGSVNILPAADFNGFNLMKQSLDSEQTLSQNQDGDESRCHLKTTSTNANAIL